ncbi:hypothetical protein LRS74_01595 [Streptomyces sp. LX-29]|uniref:hypothetical protein n=1 Tax=Streptomyces sp. LX-29 TaxID=2900152 RepID=UPI00240E44F2|nr:hypothetical protein [Streptomyces sp. LX-29]WFB05862.1 hypothetical protein LRS74_01595 [Streptomyces sp. LX-29]
MVVAAGVFLVSGCSGQDPVDDPKGTDKEEASVTPSAGAPSTGSSPATGSPSVTPSPSGHRPLTAARLKSLLLREKEVPQVDSAPVQGPVSRYEPPAVVAGPDCQEVFDALVAHDASTSVIQDFWWQNDRWGARTWLASYSGTEASAQFQRLREGLRTCKALKGDTPQGKLNSRVTVVKAPAIGDETVAFDLSMKGPDRTVLIDHHIMVRVGALTVDFSDRGTLGKPRFPLDAVVEKQMDRLTDRSRV